MSDLTLTSCRRIVVKVGTSTLTYPTGSLHYRRIERLVGVLADLQNAGKQMVLVSSGAVGIGVGELGLLDRPVDTPTRQACAAIGQCELMYTYERLFAPYRRKVAQILLTRDTVSMPKSRDNVRNTFERLIDLGIIPIVNENDAVAVDEIAYDDHNTFGDNDTLSAIVGTLSNADLLVMLSDIDGLYDQNPRLSSEAKLIPRVTHITDVMRQNAAGSGTTLGTGGMLTKLNAAELAGEYGFPTVILNGTVPDLLYDLLDGKPVGTLFDLTRLS